MYQNSIMKAVMPPMLFLINQTKKEISKCCVMCTEADENLSMIQVNLCQKLFFLQNVGRTCCVKELIWMSEKISVHNMFSPVLSLEFSCIELVIQWTICCLILWVSWWKIRASDKDLLVSQYFWTRYVSVLELIFPLYYLNQLYKVVTQKL